MSDVIGERILTQAREIAFPRYPGSNGDPRARAIVRKRFEAAGLVVSEQPFSYDIRFAFRALKFALVVGGLLLGAAGAVATHSTTIALGLVAVGIVGGGTILIWSPGIEKLYRRDGPTVTANVTARRQVNQPRRTLIFMAHHDSKSQNLTFPWRIGMTLLAIAGTLGLLTLLIAAATEFVSPVPRGLANGLGLAGAVPLFVLATLRNGNLSPGGVSNAGSVAILFELARRLPHLLPDDVELIFICPGAGEEHMVGAIRWLEANRRELDGRDVFALNFDGAGPPGTAVLIDRYGLGKSFSPPLSRVVRRVAERMGIPLHSAWLFPATGLDAIPFDHRGVDCLTLSSGSWRRASLARHSPGDVADNLDAATLSRIGDLATEVAKELALPDAVAGTGAKIDPVLGFRLEEASAGD